MKRNYLVESVRGVDLVVGDKVEKKRWFKPRELWKVVDVRKRDDGGPYPTEHATVTFENGEVEHYNWQAESRGNYEAYDEVVIWARLQKVLSPELIMEAAKFRRAFD